MSITPGPVILIGSGETGPRIRTVYHWLFNQVDKPIQMAILETPAGFEPNSNRVAGQIADFIQERLPNFRPRVSIIPARKRGTPFSPDDPNILTPLIEANVIMMGPGSPTYTVRQLQNSAAWHTLIARHRLGAALILASAATVAAGSCALPVYEIYKVGEELHWKPGLALFEPYGLSLVLVPHWNNTDGGADLDTSRCYMGQVRYGQLNELLPSGMTTIGLDEHTALVVDFEAGLCRVMGLGQVTVAREGRPESVAAGQAFPLAELGSFQQPAPQTDLPADIWARVQAAHKKPGQQPEKRAAPPPEVMALVEARAAARRRRDWSAADALREEIEASGWKLHDTPDGSTLEPR